MELREALTQIYEIRQQVARSECFRGYRAIPVAFSGVLALVCAALQSLWMTEPSNNLWGYFSSWVAVAVVSMFITGMEMLWRCRHSTTPLTEVTTQLAVTQFLPSVFAGGLLLLVMAIYCPETLWMLPGLWSILFSLGIFASYRLLPRATFFVALFYLAAGFVCLAVAQDAWAFSPWAMGLPFGIGQLFSAATLYWTLERTDVEF